VTRVGIVGASGATGRVVAAELAALGDVELVLGARRPERLRALDLEADAVAVDVFDDDSLRRLCRDCTVVVNCAGPSAAVFDRVARAAVGEGRHYVDPGGDEELVDELGQSWAEPARKDVTAVFSAGWIPGLSGLLAHHVHRTARARMDDVEAVDLYCGDSNVWSSTGFTDALSVFARYPGPRHYEGGEEVSQTLLEPSAWHRVHLPPPVGSRLAFTCFMKELRELARSTEARVASYVIPLGSPVTAAAMGVGVAMVGRAPGPAARLVRAAALRDASAGDAVGVLAASARGTRDGEPARVAVTVVERRHYWITGVVTALAVKAILRGAVPPGCWALCDAVEPAAFLGELADLGVHLPTVEGTDGAGQRWVQAHA
jgi:saccharopine dehydrogenase (NAD+, L-lysine forming)